MTPLGVAVMFEHLQDIPEGAILMRYEPNEPGGQTCCHRGNISDGHLINTKAVSRYW